MKLTHVHVHVCNVLIISTVPWRLLTFHVLNIYWPGHVKWNARKLLYHKPWLEVCHQIYHIIILCVWNSVTNCLGLNVVKVAHDMNHLLVSVYPLSSTSMVSSTGLSTHCLFYHFFSTCCLLLVSLCPLSSTRLSLPAVFCQSLSTHCLLPVSLYPLSSAGLSLPAVFYRSLSTHCLLLVSLYPLSSAGLSLPAVFYQSLSTCCLLSVSLYLLSFTGLSLPGLFYWSLSLQLPPSALLCLQLCFRIKFNLPSQLHIEISAKIPVFFRKKND